jgi:hypothetical protein
MEECELLAALVAADYHKLFGRHSNTTTEAVKRHIWDTIEPQISALGRLRSSEKCRKKFGYLKGEAKERVNHRSKTGGGPPLPPTPKHLRAILDVVPVEGMQGVKGVQRLVAPNTL